MTLDMQVDATACVIATDATWSTLSNGWGSSSVRRILRFSRVCDVPRGSIFSAYFLDEGISDIDLWPLPILVGQGKTSELADRVSVYLMHLRGDVKLEAISPDRAIRLATTMDFDGLADLVAEVADPSSSRTILSVHQIDRGESFLIQMRDGHSYLLQRSLLDEADDSPVTHLVLSSDGMYFEVTQESGNTFEVPWDDVLYHCEPSYEYYKGRTPSTAHDADDRAIRIGSRIAEARRSKGMSIAEVARKAGMQRPNLSRVEGGKHVPSLETIEKIADALAVPVAQLIAK